MRASPSLCVRSPPWSLVRFESLFVKSRMALRCSSRSGLQKPRWRGRMNERDSCNLSCDRAPLFFSFFTFRHLTFGVLGGTSASLWRVDGLYARNRDSKQVLTALSSIKARFVWFVVGFLWGLTIQLRRWRVPQDSLAFYVGLRDTYIF